MNRNATGMEFVNDVVSRMSRKARDRKVSCQSLNDHRVARLAEQVFHVKQLMGMTAEQIRMTFGSFSAAVSPGAAKAKAEVLGWAASHGSRNGSKSTGLVLCGKTGVGKTHLACAILSRMVVNSVRTPQFTLDRKMFGVFCNALQLKRKMRSSFSSVRNPGSRASREIIALGKAPVLVLDDLGVERDAPFFNEAVVEIADARQSGGKITIITTNKSSRQLKDRYGDAAFSRLVLSSKIILVEGKDMRGRNA